MAIKLGLIVDNEVTTPNRPFVGSVTDTWTVQLLFVPDPQFPVCRDSHT